MWSTRIDFDGVIDAVLAEHQIDANVSLEAIDPGNGGKGEAARACSAKLGGNGIEPPR